LKIREKNILADPVTLFTEAFPDATEDHLVALNNLKHRYDSVKGNLKEAQALSKKLSHQIGEMKRSRQPTEQLIQAMQEQGQTIGGLTKQLNHLSESILGYFEPETKKTSRKPLLPPARVHTESITDDEQVSIVELTDEIDDWNTYVESNPAASIYHRAEWKELIHRVFGHECYFFYAVSSERVVGVLPSVRLNSYLFGDFMVSMPYFNYGGAIANNLLIENKLMMFANDFAKKMGTGHVEYRDDVTRDSLPVRIDKVNMILSLPDNEEACWGTFPSKLRSQIRRAQREKIKIYIGGAERLADFYTVFTRNMRDLGTPVYGRVFFKEILQTFPKNSRIVSVHLGGRPVAAAFLLGYKDTLEIPWASTIKDVNRLSINMLLYWEVLKFAVEQRYLFFDFGRSSQDSGTFHFKRQWGAIPKQLYWHYWMPDDVDLPIINPDNPRYSLAISLWKKLPVSFTKLIGPYIVKNLP
jgi:FemAB-related protein (PEP-CTERM system-associated)